MHDDSHSDVFAVTRKLYGVDEKLLRDPGVMHILSVLQEDELPEALAAYGGTHVYAATDRRMIVANKTTFSDKSRRRPITGTTT